MNTPALNSSDVAQAPVSGAMLATNIAQTAPNGHLDELHPNDSTKLAPHWAEFFDHLGPDGLGDLNRRQQCVERQLRDNGVTHNVYADESDMQRPWSLDLFPLIVPPQDWAEIEAGVLQRTRLLNQILADLYGPRHLLQEALLPPALVQGHPGYLRAMHGVQPAGGTWLHIAAFDLAHGPDGQWWVVSQRTQAPSGLGYLLENRIAIARQFPTAFSAMHVQRIGGSYKALMQGLQALSPKGTDARIALLTPGPHNETYFEHAYLARYLGLTLVEGRDLTVRDQRVYLKTLDGLEPVDVLINRLDDEWLDPLELRSDSALGVPGLMQAVRAGHVLLANAPGSAPLESSGLLGFLPAISERLLGEKLQLPSLDTWWCGEAATLHNALPMLKQCVIKSTSPGADSPSTFGPTLDSASIDRFSDRIARLPDEHTLQAYLPLSHNPTWHEGTIAPRAAMLRVFALTDGHNSWRVLPGGMVRLAPRGQLMASMQRGGSSADCWALTRGEVDHTSLLRPTNSSLSLAQHKRIITSRSAEDLFWLGRYTERAENTVRQARLTLLALQSEEQDDAALLTWLSAHALHQGLVLPTTPEPRQTLRVFERNLIAMLAADSGATSVGFNLRALRQAANQVRERLSQEQRGLIERVDDEFAAHQAGLNADAEYAPQKALDALDQANERLCALAGVQTDRMVRDDGWHMLSMGRHIERLHTLTHAMLLALDTRSLYNDNGYEALLRLFDCTIPFHAQYQQRRDWVALLDMLVVDLDNPRSLGGVLNTLRTHVLKLPYRAWEDGDLISLLPDPSEWDLTSLVGAMPHPPIQEEPQADPTPVETPPALRVLLRTLEQTAWNLSDRMAQCYFSHADRFNQTLVA